MKVRAGICCLQSLLSAHGNVLRQDTRTGNSGLAGSRAEESSSLGQALQFSSSNALWLGTKRCHPKTATLLAHEPEASSPVPISPSGLLAPGETQPFKARSCRC